MSSMSTRSFRLTDDDVVDYAMATGDRNPLHVDADFARRSPYGRPIAHGALIVTLALGALFEDLDPRVVRQLRVTFRQPAIPGRRYQIEWSVSDGEARGKVSFGGIEAVGIRCGLGPELPVSTETAPNHPYRRTARRLNPANPPGPEAGAFSVGYRLISDVVERVTGGGVPEHLATLLGWVSYWTGMHTPGRDALLVACSIEFERAGTGAIEFGTETPDIDRRSGLITLRARTRCGADAAVTIESLVREPVPGPEPGEIAAVLPVSRSLAGRTVLVVGGSRGLGAAVSLALAGQGARVLIGCTRRPEALLATAPGWADRLIPVIADASDPRALAAALPDEPLDGVVCLAAPAIPTLPLAADAIDPAIDFIGESSRLVLTPLSVCAARLRPDATVVLVSSEAVIDPPRWWPHYAAAKGVVEGLAHYVARHHPWRVVVARPPRLWTEMTNTPGGRAQSNPIGPVAAGIVGAFLAPAVPGEVTVLGGSNAWTAPSEEVWRAGNSRPEQVLR
ncbi:SDR family NAD(P)-dependent oxidoreductase [Nocardia pseudobrasiliensis]|uniref:NAD(P)-dependent dehydrogenase (Short-subunit alcohol dehydrogenase family) n=1 Tax=Nocardia pseudobrasiliensis TaxID=45979 RepID=A0A370IDT7_9NOCA|nr:SDR family NAD(P)-dependent oxidoreductase [Nocardia pseudobrasiliensis]RDI68875.1 NAD(P)-dependent dehydrogenase (short-subunit alcohol dehydrogenase family) [Nocardia pseudobrasiliensis]